MSINFQSMLNYAVDDKSVEDFIRLVSCQHVPFQQLSPTQQRQEAIKFLFARKFQVDNAVRIYLANQKLRQAEGLHHIDPRSEPVRKELLSGKLTIWSHENWHNGAAIALFTARLHHPGQVEERDTLRALVLQLDAAMESESAQRTGVIFIYDMSRAKYEHFDLHLSTRIVTLMQGCYPAHLGRVFIVSPPLWFRAPLRMLRVFLREKLRQRIVTVNSRAELWRTHFTPEHLSKRGFTAKEFPLAQEMESPGSELMDYHREWLRTRVLIDWTGVLPHDYFNSSSGVTVKQSLLEDRPRSSRPALLTPLFPSPQLTATSSQSSSSSNTSLSFFAGGSRRISRSASTSTRFDLAPSDETTSALPRTSSRETPLVPRRQAPSLPADSLPSQPPRLPGPSLHGDDDHEGESLKEFVARLEQPNAWEALEREFKLEVQGKETRALAEADIASFKKSSNSPLNRYRDVQCLEWSRVALHLSASHDYIHANWVDGYRQKDAFICCQGPLPNTIVDFWALIWEYRVPLVLMTTKLLEQRKVKCHIYWPKRQGEASEVMHVDGEVRLLVRNEAVVKTADFRTTQLTITNLASGEVRSVTHLYFTAWPDHAAPPSVEAFLSLLDAYRQHYTTALLKLGFKVQVEHGVPLVECDDSLPPPTVVHCSAGVGRTGTFVAVDIETKRAVHTGRVNVQRCVHLMRTQRHASVQTVQQFAFIHTAVLEFVKRTGLLLSVGEHSIHPTHELTHRNELL